MYPLRVVGNKVINFGCQRLTVLPSWRWLGRGMKVATDGEVRRMRLPLHFSVSPTPLQLIRPLAPAPERGAA